MTNRALGQGQCPTLHLEAAGVKKGLWKNGDVLKEYMIYSTDNREIVSSLLPTSDSK